MRLVGRPLFGQQGNLPPSLRFPPLREGNRGGRIAWFPLHAGGRNNCLCGEFSTYGNCYPPLLTSPVHGGGTAAPSPRAGRAGVGAMFKSLRKGTYQPRVRKLPTSCRVPHAREGNCRTPNWFPLQTGETEPFQFPSRQRGEPVGGGQNPHFRITLAPLDL